MQSQFFMWLAVLPIILAMFRAISIGDRLYATVQPGRQGGHHNQLTNLILAGLVFIGAVFILFVGGNAAGQIEDALALSLAAFGAFIVSGYMAAGFRSKVWQKFFSHALHEAGVFWLVLSLCRLMLLLTDRATPTGTGQTPPPSNQKLVFLEGTVYAVVAFVALALIVGTFGRMRKR